MLYTRRAVSVAGSRAGEVVMKAFVDIECAAKVLAEARVPGSTRPGGHYHLSESWRSMLQRQARGARPPGGATLPGAPLAA